MIDMSAGKKISRLARCGGLAARLLIRYKLHPGLSSCAKRVLDIHESHAPPKWQIFPCSGLVAAPTAYQHNFSSCHDPDALASHLHCADDRIPAGSYDIPDTWLARESRVGASGAQF
jgi:hypothetical protein